MEGQRESFSFSVSAPGKVILFGEHSVVYKKAAVSTSISKRLHVYVKSNQENLISFWLPQINAKMNCNLEALEKVVKLNCPSKSESSYDFNDPEIIDHDLYIKSLNENLESLGINICSLEDKSRLALIGIFYVMRGMFSRIECKLVPFSLEVNSELEVGAGTGSSAAFAVAISGSIYQLCKILEGSNQGNVRQDSFVKDNVIIKTYSKDTGFSVEEVRIINRWAFCIEKIMHGQPSGIDNTTCAFGSVVVTSQDEISPGNLTFRFLVNIPNIKILLISTGVSRNTAHLVAKVRQLRDVNPAAVDSILNSMEVIALEAFKTLNKLGDSSITGDKTGLLQLYEVLSGLMNLNHGLLRTLGVSHQSLERIVSVTSLHGLASKLTGAGGGGYAITLLPPNISNNQIENLKRDLDPFQVTEISIAENGIRLD